jgi:hypothetical protein
MSEDARDFLSRWSRRKTEARQVEAEPKPADAPAAPAGTDPRPEAQATLPAGSSDGAAAASASLPPLDSLDGVASDYSGFLQPEVDESLRRGALKQLFRDPHFNVMDRLDIYIDDYSKEDPIPDAMLKALNHAQGLIFDREDQPAESDPQLAAGAAAEPTAALPEAGAGAPQDEAQQEKVPAQPKPSSAG